MEVLQEIKTRVYKFGDKKADGNSKMKNLLGGKGANLAEMSAIGIPVPPGFTITTEVCTEYNLLGQDAVVEMIMDKATGRALKGSGTGDLRIEIDTKGKFNMYGDFVIDSTAICQLNRLSDTLQS